MASGNEELLREFELTRRDLDEMAEELAAAEDRVTALARQDVQVGDLRQMLAEARQQHSRLARRERTLRAKFRAVLDDGPKRTH